LDFTKGALVLLMILYHWANYFLSLSEDVYKYFRFITPSFIFITGFLVVNVYLGRYQVGDPRLHRRLVERGAKLLVVFTLLNLAGSAAMGAGPAAFLEHAREIYLIGNSSAAAFSVLVPISYLLLLSSVLLFLCKWTKALLPLVCLALFGSIFALDLNSIGNANLELFAVGVFGMVIGMIPIDDVNRFARHILAVFLAYAVYLVALTIWREIYPMQVVGVCLSLLLLYSIGSCVRAASSGWVVLLGKYTLLSYIVQIAVLVILAKLLRRGIESPEFRAALACLLAFAGTYVIILGVDKAREAFPLADKAYKFVFA
jgi:peptidoglycan/LPS O-acetylase OafA/YrhL